MSAVVRTFYKRQLPKELVCFSSTEGKKLFKSALLAGYAENYFQLANYFTTQSEPAFCGLGSLSMALNALEVDPLRVWKGPWRWFVDEMLDCCRSLEDIRSKGITLSEFSCLARCNGLSVKTQLATTEAISLDRFENDIKSSCDSTDQVMVASFSRKTLHQTGDGHFSPIGAYTPDSKMVLVMDVARFKYPAYWVPLSLLHQSLHPLDPVTQLPRGYSLLRKKAGLSASLTHLTVTKSGWRRLVECWQASLVPTLNDPFDFWSTIAKCYLVESKESNAPLIGKRIIVVQEDETKPPIRFGCSENELEFKSQYELLIAGVRATNLYNFLKNLTLEPLELELITLFFLSIPYHDLFAAKISQSLLAQIISTIEVDQDKIDLSSILPNNGTKGCTPVGCGCITASNDKALSTLKSEIDYLKSQFTNLNQCIAEESLD